MGLRELATAKAVIKTSGGDLAVRGLSTADVAILIRSHEKEAVEIFDKVISQEADDDSVRTDLAIDVLGRALLDSAPRLVAHAIALAADDPDGLEFAERLPFPVQLAAVEKIGELTFSMEGGPKKVLETVIRLVSGATHLVKDLQDEKDSAAGSGG